MANIFLAFPNSLYDENDYNKMPCFYESFIKGLKEHGNNVMFWHDLIHWNKDFEKISNEALADIKKFNPELIILFNNSFYDISKQFDCPIVVYEVDSPLYYSNKNNLKQNANRYKFLIPQSNSIDILMNDFGVKKENIYLIDYFSSVKPEEKEKTTNISFIGSNFTAGDPIEKFMKLQPSKEEIITLKSILNYIEKNPFIKKDELVKKLNIESKAILKCLDTESYVWQLSSSKRAQVLSEIADLGLSLYGTKDWLNNLPYNLEILLSYKHENIYSLKHNQDIYNSSKICININHIQAVNGFSWRVCDIMASSGCLVSEYRVDFQRLFPNIKIPLFENRFEAREQCLKILNNENLRQDIVADCNEIIDKSFRFKHLLKKIEQITGLNLNDIKTPNNEKFLTTNIKPKGKNKLSFKNKIRYKIWKHFDKILRKKGIIK